jgi:hypothetical protein
MSRVPPPADPRRFVLAAAALAVGLGGCTDKAKTSEAQARSEVASVAALVDKDAGEIESGLPKGAEKLAALWAKGGDPHQDLPAVRSALLRMRRDVPDLTVAKSTFFALADDKGVAVRNDLEEDAMAGTNLVAIFPELAKAEAGGYVTTTGAFPGPVLPSGPDKDWLAAAPVKKADGAVGGILVTGWTYRRFAYHLQETLRHDEQEKAGSGQIPVLYVMLFDKTGAYGARQTPPINEKAMADLDLVAKTAGGPSGVVSGRASITDRDFGWAAMRTPKLGVDTGVVVLRSEL